MEERTEFAGWGSAFWSVERSAMTCAIWRNSDMAVGFGGGDRVLVRVEGELVGGFTAERAGGSSFTKWSPKAYAGPSRIDSLDGLVIRWMQVRDLTRRIS